jgi:hypothetical protein
LRVDISPVGGRDGGQLGHDTGWYNGDAREISESDGDGYRK